MEYKELYNGAIIIMTINGERFGVITRIKRGLYVTTPLKDNDKLKPVINFNSMISKTVLEAWYYDYIRKEKTNEQFTNTSVKSEDIEAFAKDIMALADTEAVSLPLTDKYTIVAYCNERDVQLELIINYGTDDEIVTCFYTKKNDFDAVYDDIKNIMIDYYSEIFE